MLLITGAELGVPRPAIIEGIEYFAWIGGRTKGVRAEHLLVTAQVASTGECCAGASATS